MAAQAVIAHLKPDEGPNVKALAAQAATWNDGIACGADAFSIGNEPVNERSQHLRACVEPSDWHRPVTLLETTFSAISKITEYRGQ